MSKSAARARLVNSGVVYTFAAATVAGMITFIAFEWVLENLLGLGFFFAFLPGILLAVAMAFFVRGRLGGKWMLSAFRQNELAEHRHLMMDAQANHLIDLPTESLYTYFGPSKLTKIELERYYQKALSYRDLSFSSPEKPDAASNLYNRVSGYSTVVPSSKVSVEKPSSAGSYTISGKRLLKSMLGSIWQIIAVIFMLKFFSISWIGILLLGAAVYYLFEKHWESIRQYQDKIKILFFNQDGVKINFPDGQLTLAWRDIDDVVFRNVLVEDSTDDEWLQLSTSTRGQVSLRLNLLNVESPEEIEKSFTAWRTWAHQERMRIAMGGQG